MQQTNNKLKKQCQNNKAVGLIVVIMLKNIRVRESHATVIRNLGRLSFSRKTSANVIKLDASK